MFRETKEKLFLYFLKIDLFLYFRKRNPALPSPNPKKQTNQPRKKILMFPETELLSSNIKKKFRKGKLFLYFLK